MIKKQTGAKKIHAYKSTEEVKKNQLSINFFSSNVTTVTNPATNLIRVTNFLRLSAHLFPACKKNFPVITSLTSLELILNDLCVHGSAIMH